MADITMVDNDAHTEYFTGSTVYASPSANAVKERLIKQFPEYCKDAGDGVVAIPEGVWNKKYKEIGDWLESHFCGLGYNNGRLSIHPRTVTIF